MKNLECPAREWGQGEGTEAGHDEMKRAFQGGESED